MDNKESQNNPELPVDCRQIGDNASKSDSNMVQPQELSDSDKSKFDNLMSLLAEQEETFENEVEGVDREKQAAKESLADAFKNLHEVLVKKEGEMLEKINTEYGTAERFLSEILSCIKVDKKKVNDLLTVGKAFAGDNEEVDVEKLKKDIDASLDLRNDTLNQFCVPCLVLNEESVETFRGLSFGELRESAPGVTDRTVMDDEESVGTASDISDAEGIEGAEAAGYSGNQGQVRERTQGSTGVSGKALTPSAPTIDREDAPPPYWQAMGLSGPPEELIEPNDRLPENKLELLNCFRVRRQSGRRNPVPVALTWNFGRICIVDKANTKVEFFYPDGQFITEMIFDGAELRDVTFLDESLNGDTRYVVTCPKKRLLMIIGIDAENVPRVFKKHVFRQMYQSICRGPRIQTLVGAEVSKTTGRPCVVNMLTLTGKVLLSIAHAPSFVLWQYIKSVQVFGSNIIILDWKINLAAVYRDDGSAVGEYRGTEHSPLINPSDMTLDGHGNVLILNGEFQNIHVIDLKCQPLEVIEIPRDNSSSISRLKLIAFDLETQRLCIAKGNGDVEVFTFQDDYDCTPQGSNHPRLLVPHQNITNREQREPEVLPLVEGMLPSTIESIINKQSERRERDPDSPRSRHRKFRRGAFE